MKHPLSPAQRECLDDLTAHIRETGRPARYRDLVGPGRTLEQVYHLCDKLEMRGWIRRGQKLDLVVK